MLFKRKRKQKQTIEYSISVCNSMVEYRAFNTGVACSSHVRRTEHVSPTGMASAS